MEEGSNMRFINDDAALRHDQRVVPYLNSTWTLSTIIERRAVECGYHRKNPLTPEWPRHDANIHTIIKAIMKGDTVIKDDNKFCVGIENFICANKYPNDGDIGKAQDLLGLHAMENGLTFYGFIAGGDGQRSVFMIMYYDGENLRLYTPVWGNKLNLGRQEPLMNDSRSEKYMARYELNKKTLGFNWNAMKIDILANLQVDYANVVEDHLRMVRMLKGE